MSELNNARQRLIRAVEAGDQAQLRDILRALFREVGERRFFHLIQSFAEEYPELFPVARAVAEGDVSEEEEGDPPSGGMDSLQLLTQYETVIKPMNRVNSMVVEPTGVIYQNYIDEQVNVYKPAAALYRNLGAPLGASWRGTYGESSPLLERLAERIILLDPLACDELEEISARGIPFSFWQQLYAIYQEMEAMTNRLRQVLAQVNFSDEK